MSTKEQIAHSITAIRAYLKTKWEIPRYWTADLLAAYDNMVDEANAWRRTYNQVADQYRDLLASKPEVYLVDGHDAAYWARNAKLAVDVATAANRNYLSLKTRHEALTAQYLALRTKYDRLQHVATECEEELHEINQINA